MLPWKWPMNQTSQSCCQWKEINLHEPCLSILCNILMGIVTQTPDTWYSRDTGNYPEIKQWLLISFLAMFQHSIPFVTTSSSASHTEPGWLTRHVTTVLMRWWFLIPSSATSLSFQPFRLNPESRVTIYIYTTLQRVKAVSNFEINLSASFCGSHTDIHNCLELVANAINLVGSNHKNYFQRFNKSEQLCGKIYFLKSRETFTMIAILCWIQRFLSPSSFVNRHTFLNACQEIFCFTIDLFLLIEAVRQKICRRRENLQTGKQKFISTYQSGLQNSNAKYRRSLYVEYSTYIIVWNDNNRGAPEKH